MTPADYCREIETYLCRKNDGHLIRLVGPAFERVRDWVAQGVPLKVVFEGIDRHFERYYAKGPRRWPVRIEFCESDVMAVFDGWRRAVGLPSAVPEEPGGAHEDVAPARSSRPSLQKHLDRLVDKLTTLRAKQPAESVFGRALDRALDELEAARGGTRGAARARLIDQLDELERSLTVAAREALPPASLQQFEKESLREMEPFRPRMTEETFTATVGRATDRLVRREAGLPQIRFE